LSTPDRRRRRRLIKAAKKEAWGVSKKAAEGYQTLVKEYQA